jgi:hypothetical protein
MAVVYPYDINGSLDSNEIKNELHTFPSVGSRGFSMIAPKVAPFHKRNFKLLLEDGTPLVENVDYQFGWYYEGLSSKQNAPEIFMAIVLKNMNLVGNRVKVTYHTVGAEFVMVNSDWQDFARNQVVNPLDTIWDVLIDRPGLYSTDPNLVLMEDAVGWDRFISKVSQLVDESSLMYNKIKTMIDLHVNNEVNAHQVDLDALGIERFRNLKKATLSVIEAGVNPTQYLGVVETREFLKRHYVPINGTTSISLNGPTVAYQGGNVSWVITDFDSFSEYQVESDYMSLSITDNLVRGTVDETANIGNRSFTVFKNSVPKTFTLNVLGIGIGQPSLVGILEGESNVSTIVTVNSSSFSSLPNGSDSFSVIQYEVSTTESFSDIVYSRTLDELTPLTLDLPERTQLYARIRHIGESGRISAWSRVIRFITGDDVVATPPVPNTSISWRDNVTVTTNQTTGERENVRVKAGVSVNSLSPMNSDTSLLLELTGDGKRAVLTHSAYMSYVNNNEQIVRFSQWEADHVNGPQTIELEARFYREIEGAREYSETTSRHTINTSEYMN